MSAVAVERKFSVSVEMMDGTTRVVSVHDETSNDAFQQVKAMPGVRRVGKVREGGDRGEPQRQANEPSQKLGQTTHAVQRSSNLNAGIMGPRVVLHVRRSGGEQPFKHLQAPPPRPIPPAPPPRVVEAPIVVEAPPSVVEGDDFDVAEPSNLITAPREYRVVKSRRQGGSPYILQRGSWQQTGEKRIFSSVWEKGFEDREKAIKHQAWLQQGEREIAELD